MSKDAESTIADQEPDQKPVNATATKPAKRAKNEPKKMTKTLIAQTILGILFSIAVLAVLVYFVFVGVPTF